MRHSVIKRLFLISSTKVTGAAGISQLPLRQFQITRHIFDTVFVNHHVIFDTNAAKRFQRLNFLPVEVLAERAFTPRRQQDSIK
jgi:hypothetical protein